MAAFPVDISDILIVVSPGAAYAFLHSEVGMSPGLCIFSGSRKRSGSAAGYDTHDILKLIGGYPMLSCQFVERVAGPEPVEHVLHSGTTPFEDG